MVSSTWRGKGTDHPLVGARHLAGIGDRDRHVFFALIEDTPKVDVLAVQGQVGEVDLRQQGHVVALRVVHVRHLLAQGGVR